MPRAGARPARRGGHGHERRAVAVQAAVVGVAGRLVDLRLAAQLGVHRVHGQAARLRAAVAAPLAHRLVDDHAPGPLGGLPALAQPPQLGGARLVVHDQGDARHLGQGALGLGEPVPAPHLRARGQGRAAVARRVLAHHDDPGHALGGHGLAQVRHVELPGRVLPAGHRDHAVVEDLEGHGHPGRHRGAHGQAAGVEERPVAHVLHEVRDVGERRAADPLRALAAHLVVGHGAAVQPHDHGVAAHAAAHRRARAREGGPVVRAAAAEGGRAGRGVRDDGQPGALLLRMSGRNDQRRGQPLFQPPGQQRAQPVGGQLAADRDQRPVPLVALAGHPGPLGLVVQVLADEALHERALLLDDEDLRDAPGGGPDDARLQRVDHAQPDQPDPGVADLLVAGQPQAGQGLADLAVGAAGGQDRQPRVRRVDLHGVEPVLGRVRPGRGVAALVELGLELDRVRQEEGGPLREPPRPAVEGQLRLPRGDAAGGDVGRAKPVRDRGDDLQRGPAAAVARQLVAVPAEVEHLLDGAGHQDRHPRVVQRRLARARQGGRLGLRVVARRHDHAAVGAGAVHVGVPEHVAAPVHARRLAVPHADDPVVPAQRRQVVLLAAPHGGGGQVLVHPRDPVHVVLGQQRPGALQGLVEAAERRAGVAADERGGVKTSSPVRADLVEDHAGEGLDPGEEHAAVGDPVLRVQVEVGRAAAGGGGHGGSSDVRWS